MGVDGVDLECEVVYDGRNDTFKEIDEELLPLKLELRTASLQNSGLEHL